MGPASKLGRHAASSGAVVRCSGFEITWAEDRAPFSTAVNSFDSLRHSSTCSYAYAFGCELILLPMLIKVHSSPRRQVLLLELLVLCYE